MRQQAAIITAAASCTQSTNPPSANEMEGVWLEGSWEEAGVEDEIDGELLALLIIRDE
jgi:hypothetical protein